MRFESHRTCPPSILLFISFLTCGIAFAETYSLAVASIEAQGGWDYQRALDQSEMFGDTVMATAPDRYGQRNTPLWIAIIDPEAGGMIESKPPNWQTYWEAEDYVMNAQGNNLYRDLPTLSAFLELSRITGDPRYRDSVNDYLRFYLREMPSETTGLWPWGEHLSYNTVRDRIYAKKHELEANLPDWEMLWSIDPDAVRREIEGIHKYAIYDKDTYMYDRHAQYFTGELADAPVRGAYIKHGGLFAYSFLFLYSKTGDSRYLDWARKMSDLYWRQRDPKTNLLPSYVWPGGAASDSQWIPILAYYLLEAACIYPDPYVMERGLGMLDAQLKYGYDQNTGQLTLTFDDKSTGVPTNPFFAPWDEKEISPFNCILAFWRAYELTGKQQYCDVVEKQLDMHAETPVPDTVPACVIGAWIGLATKAYQATGHKRHLELARSLAAYSEIRLVRRGLIIESANGYVYNNTALPGMLLQGWLDLYETEKEEPIHWLAPASASLQDKELVVVAAAPSSKDLRLNWQFHDGTKGSQEQSTPDGRFTFHIPIATDSAQGPLTLRFVQRSNDAVLDTGTVLVAANPNGPSIKSIDCPHWIDRQSPLTGEVTVDDPTGITEVTCHYTLPDGSVGTTPCTPETANASQYTFTIPAVGESVHDELSFQITATGNPGWPITNESAVHQVALSTVSDIQLTGQGGQAITQAVAGHDPEVSIVLEPSHDATAAHVRVERIPIDPESNQKGLPKSLLTHYFSVTPGDSAAGGSLELRLTFDPEELFHYLPSTVAAYRWGGERWEAVPDTTLDPTGHTLTFPCSEKGMYVAGGDGRLAWRRTFNGALLSSPAVARIDADGHVAIILNTGNPDGKLYALTPGGETLWTYDVEDGQPFPAVFDLNGDGLDEIAVGGKDLVLLSSDGTIRWEVNLPGTSVPAVGDVNGDGSPDIVAATYIGTVAAFSADGKPLWRKDDVCNDLQYPALGNVNGDGNLDVVVGGEGHLFAFSGKDGKMLWKATLPGDSMYAPALADLDGDGMCEVVDYARTDTEGAMTAFDGDGTVLWNVAVSREPDWAPVVAPMSGDDTPQIIAQEIDPKKMGIHDARGQLVRTIDTPGRLLAPPTPVDLNGDGLLDLLVPVDIAMQLRAYANDGSVLWIYTPHSFTLSGAKIKGGGTLLVADTDGDGYLNVVGGDDETWLNALTTDTPCKPFAVASGQFHGDAHHDNDFTKQKK